jgi:hypothetical protein
VLGWDRYVGPAGRVIISSAPYPSSSSRPPATEYERSPPPNLDDHSLLVFGYDRDLLAGWCDHPSHPLVSSSGRGQVLIPWPNRLEDGSYEFDGRRYQPPLNEPEHRNAIHGLVRWSAWTATEREPHRVVMETHSLSTTRLSVLAGN